MPSSPAMVPETESTSRNAVFPWLKKLRMLAGLLAATDASGPPAAAPPPLTPGSDWARLNNGNSSDNNRNRANGHVRRVIEPPPLRVERENRTDGITPPVMADATVTVLLPKSLGWALG